VAISCNRLICRHNVCWCVRRLVQQQPKGPHRTWSLKPANTDVGLFSCRTLSVPPLGMRTHSRLSMSAFDGALFRILIRVFTSLKWLLLSEVMHADLSLPAPASGRPRFCATRYPAGRWSAAPGSVVAYDACHGMHGCCNGLGNHVPRCSAALCMLCWIKQHLTYDRHARRVEANQQTFLRVAAHAAGKHQAVCSMLLKWRSAGMQPLTAPPLLPSVMLPNWCFPGSPIEPQEAGPPPLGPVLCPRAVLAT
jgi:hypothetical protein